MSLQYIQNNASVLTVVLVPIDDWNKIIEKHNDLEGLTKCQKQLIDSRIILAKNHPESLIPLNEFMHELDKNEAF
jgi:hypothetical protein